MVYHLVRMVCIISFVLFFVLLLFLSVKHVAHFFNVQASMRGISQHFLLFYGSFCFSLVPVLLCPLLVELSHFSLTSIF